MNDPTAKPVRFPEHIRAPKNPRTNFSVAWLAVLNMAGAGNSAGIKSENFAPAFELLQKFGAKLNEKSWEIANWQFPPLSQIYRPLL